MTADDAEEKALEETRAAIEVVQGTSEPVELSPQSSYIRRLQHQLAERYELHSDSVGSEPFRRVRITKE